MELKDLVGPHMLTGVDFEDVMGEARWQDANSCRFCLDGTVYCAIEDPDDGYRSMMGQLVIDACPIQNRFEAVRVVGVYVDDSRYEVLRLIDEQTGKTVLEVGTDHDDDYYPSFVSDFQPQNMSVNAEMIEEAGE